MLPWTKTINAIADYHRFMVDHNKKFEETKTAMDAQHWFQLRDKQISKIHQAFWKDSQPWFNLNQCRAFSLKQIQEKVGYGIS